MATTLRVVALAALFCLPAARNAASVNSPASLYFEIFGGGIAPAIQDGPVLFTTPFTLSGLVNLPFPSSGPTVFGRGIATVLLRPQFPIPGEPAQWLPESVRYDLTPVPEPGTIILVSGGLLAIGRAARRSRRDRASTRLQSGSARAAADASSACPARVG
jgi:PEP-CTERM motif